MHMVLTGGSHPLSVIGKKKGSSHEDYKEALLSLNQNLEASPELTKLAKSLFENFCKLSASQRYTAKEALKHPWITRKLQD